MCHRFLETPAVFSCVLRADRKTERPSLWMSLLLSLSLFPLCTRSLLLTLPLSLSLSLMPVSIWRLIKCYPASQQHISHHQPLLGISSLLQQGWRECTSVHAHAAMRMIKFIYLSVFCVCVLFGVYFNV